MLTHRGDTILGNIPRDWEAVPLRRLLAYQKGGDWGEDDGGIETKVLRSTNFTVDGHLDFSDVAIRYLTASSAEKLQLKKGDLLLERSGGGPTQPVGRIGFIQQDLPGHACSNFVQLLRPDADEINPEYLGWVLYAINRSGVVERLQHQTTQMRNLDYRDYIRTLVPKPSRPEQDAIVHAVRTADEAIAKTKDEIEATCRLKKAWMQQLFTRGLPGRHTKFVKTKWLAFPEGWKLKPLKSLASVTSGFTMGRDLSGYERITVPYVTVVNVQEGYFDLENVSTAEIKLSEIESDTLQVNDVLMTEGGDRDKLGRGAIWRGEVEPCAFQNHIFRIRFYGDIEDAYSPELFHFLLQTYQAKNYFYTHAKQTSNLCTINSRELKKFPVAVPEPDEQQEMLNILVSIGACLDALQTELDALYKLKTSLLQNLLTGKVRVKAEVSA